MKTTSRRAMVLVGALAVGAVAASVGVANASANSKQPKYDSSADSSAGLDILGLVSIGDTRSSSQTKDSDDGSKSSSSAHALRLNGEDQGGSAECGSEGTDNQGVARDQDQGELLTLGGDPAPVTVTLLSASCESRAVQSNNASSWSKTSVIGADVAGTEIVVLGSSSSTKTTSGQAGSGQTESSFTVASVGDTDLVSCGASSQSTKTGTKSSSSVTVVGQEQRDAPCPLASASTTYEQGN